MKFLLYTLISLLFCFTGYSQQTGFKYDAQNTLYKTWTLQNYARWSSSSKNAFAKLGAIAYYDSLNKRFYLISDSTGDTDAIWIVTDTVNIPQFLIVGQRIIGTIDSSVGASISDTSRKSFSELTPSEWDISDSNRIPSLSNTRYKLKWGSLWFVNDTLLQARAFQAIGIADASYAPNNSIFYDELRRNLLWKNNDGLVFELPNKDVVSVCVVCPVITSLDINEKYVYSDAFTLTVYGSNFNSSSVVLFNGAVRSSSYDAAEGSLQAEITGDDLIVPGVYQVTVSNVTPEHGSSNGVNFSVKSKVPIVTSLYPNEVSLGSGVVSVKIIGSNFDFGSKIYCNGQIHTVTNTDNLPLNLFFDLPDQSVAGSFPVYVFNPTPGGGTSEVFFLKVGAPPIISVGDPFDPVYVDVGHATFTLQINGSDFVNDVTTTVTFNGHLLSGGDILSIASDKITVTIPESYVADPGYKSVKVFNYGNIPSEPVNFPVNSLGASLSSLSQSQGFIYDGNTTITLTGDNFYSNYSVVTVSGVVMASQVSSSTQMTILIPSSVLSSSVPPGFGVGDYDVVVTNPLPGGGVSDAQVFSISNPTPKVISVSPSKIPVNSADPVLITITGDDFISEATVKFGGTTIDGGDVTFVGANIMKALIPTSLMTAIGSNSIVVTNPSPEGGASNANVVVEITQSEVELDRLSSYSGPVFWWSSGSISKYDLFGEDDINSDKKKKGAVFKIVITGKWKTVGSKMFPKKYKGGTKVEKLKKVWELSKFQPAIYFGKPSEAGFPLVSKFMKVYFNGANGKGDYTGNLGKLEPVIKKIFPGFSNKITKTNWDDMASPPANYGLNFDDETSVISRKFEMVVYLYLEDAPKQLNTIEDLHSNCIFSLFDGRYQPVGTTEGVDPTITVSLDNMGVRWTNSTYVKYGATGLEADNDFLQHSPIKKIKWEIPAYKLFYFSASDNSPYADLSNSEKTYANTHGIGIGFASKLPIYGSGSDIEGRSELVISTMTGEYVGHKFNSNKEDLSSLEPPSEGTDLSDYIDSQLSSGLADDQGHVGRLSQIPTPGGIPSGDDDGTVNDWVEDLPMENLAEDDTLPTETYAKTQATNNDTKRVATTEFVQNVWEQTRTTALGGTGRTTLTEDAVLYGKGSSDVGLATKQNYSLLGYDNSGDPEFFQSPKLNNSIQLGIQSTTRGYLKLSDSISNYLTSLRSYSGLSQNLTFTLPNSYGTLNQLIVTDGDGNLSFKSVTDPLLGTHSILSSLHTDVNSSASSVLQGDIIIGNSTPAWDKLSRNSSATKKFLSMTSSVGSWTTLSSSDVGLGNVENTALSTWAGSSSLTTLGTIVSGTWNANILSPTYGGTGVNNSTRTITINTNNFTVSSVNQANTITLENNFNTSGNYSLTLTQTGITNVTLPTTGTLMSLGGGQTVTSATWNGTKIGLVYGGTNADLSATGGASYVLRQSSVGSDITVSQLAASDLSNGTTGSNSVVLGTSPSITGGSHTGLTSLGIRSTGTGSYDLTIANTENLTAGKTLTVSLGDENRTLTFTGNSSISGTNTGDQTISLTSDVTGSGTGSITTTIANNAVTNGKFRQSVARSVVGVTGNATSNVADIQGTTDQVFRVNSAGTALEFGSLDLTKSGTVGTSVLPIANGGTNSSTTLNSNRIISSQSGALKEMGAMTNGQLIIGNTGTAPTIAALTAGSGVAITNGAGTITISGSSFSGSASYPGTLMFLGETSGTSYSNVDSFYVSSNLDLDYYNLLNTGAVSGASAVTEGDGVDWSPPSRALTSNNQYASSTLVWSGVNYSDSLKIYNLGISLTSVVISGFKVEVDKYISISQDIIDNQVRLMKNSIAVGSNLASASQWPTSEETSTYGSSTNLWGTTWAVSDVTSSGFGVLISGIYNSSGTSVDLNVDWIRITVYYYNTNSITLDLDSTVQIYGLTASRLVSTDASQTLVSTISAANLASSVTGTTGSGNLTFATSPQFTTGISVGGTSDNTNNSIKLYGTTSGSVTIKSAAATVSAYTITLPKGTTDFSTTGGASQVIQQTSSGGAFSVGQLSSSNLSDGTTGSGSIVLATSPTLTTPRIASGGYIADANGNELVIFTTTTSAVNELTFANSASNTNPILSVTGGSTNIGLNLVNKGSGIFRIGSTTSGGDTLSLKPQTTTTTNAFLGQITSADLTAARTWTLPDAATSIPIASQFITFSGPTAARTYTFPDAAAIIKSNLSIITLRTTADQGSITTEVAITTLQFSVNNNEVWIVDMLIFHKSAGSTDGIMFKVDGPGTSTVNLAILGFASGAWHDDFQQTTDNTYPSFGASEINSSTTVRPVLIKGIIVAGGTGTVTFYAKSVSGTTNAQTIMTNSYLKATKVE